MTTSKQKVQHLVHDQMKIYTQEPYPFEILRIYIAIRHRGQNLGFEQGDQ
jgi:hypothetical protein